MLVLGAIYCYRFALSPWLGANCRFTPTCSQYAIEAIQLHGVLKGGYLAVLRLGKCHPFSGASKLDYDPVPKHGPKRVDNAEL